MEKPTKNEISTCAAILKQGGVAVIPTDTIYGIAVCAADRSAEERLYAIKGRSFDKPCIILISDISELEQFNITLDESTRNLLASLWPNPVTVALPADNPTLEYLHRGKKSLAFRIPNYPPLLALLKLTGPLLAPSANPESEKPAATIDEARGYFAKSVDYYLDGGVLAGQPSTLLRLESDGSLTILRQGAYQLKS